MDPQKSPGVKRKQRSCQCCCDLSPVNHASPSADSADAVLSAVRAVSLIFCRRQKARGCATACAVWLNLSTQLWALHMSATCNRLLRSPETLNGGDLRTAGANPVLTTGLGWNYGNACCMPASCPRIPRDVVVPPPTVRWSVSDGTKTRIR